MTLEEAIKVKESLKELTADRETFNWGPSWEFANQRKEEALTIIKREIKNLKATRSYGHDTPPQREWQGLTNEERNFLAWESNNGPECVAMTEAKLREKNT